MSRISSAGLEFFDHTGISLLTAYTANQSTAKSASLRIAEILLTSLAGRLQESTEVGKIRALPMAGVLQHQYSRQAA
ncbi:MAG: hypothetical protein E4H32_08320 [Nitrospirales bacterium]|nr:MAG: hypothetical protein E4H32_08320 [Nitrospirales bacterium]